jgi:Ca2+-binding EF-hand superfamily protein
MNHIIRSAAQCVSVIIVSTAVASIANAAPRHEEMKVRIEKIDTNGDGKFSREESAKYKGIAKDFDKIDANKDGYLTKDEMKAQRAKKVAAKLKAIDGDQDGRISRAEADAKTPMIAKHFDKLDRNVDGFIDKDEMAAAREYRHR